MNRNNQKTERTVLDFIFRQNQLYVETLATGGWLASLILISQWIQMLSITMGSWNKHIPEWINFGFSCVNLRILHQSSIGVTALLGLTIIMNITVIVIVCIRQPSEQFKTKASWFIQLYSKLSFIPPAFCSCSMIINYFSDKPQQIPVLLLSITCLATSLPLYFNYELFFFNFTLDTKDSLARNPKKPIRFISKILLIVLGSMPSRLINIKQVIIAYYALHILNGILFIFQNCQENTLNDQQMSKVDGIACLVYVSIIATDMLLHIFPVDMIMNNSLLFIAIFLGFSLRFFLNLRNFLIKNIVQGEHNEITSAQQADLFFKVYVGTFRSASSAKQKLYISSLLKIHINKCVDPTCCCKNRDVLYDPRRMIYGNDRLQPHQDIVFVKHFVLRLLEESLKQFKGSILLSLDEGFYHLEILKLYTRASMVVQQLKLTERKKGMTLSQRFVRYQMEMMLCKVIIDKNHKAQTVLVPIENIQLFDQKIYELSQMIIQTVGHFSDMWMRVASSQPEDMLKLSNNCHQNLTIVLNIQKKFYEILEINNCSCQLRDSMELYSRFVLFDQQLTQEVGRKLKGRMIEIRGKEYGMEPDGTLPLNQLTTGSIFSSQACLLSLSHDPGMVGRITWSSKNTVNILGLTREQLRNSSVNRIMPRLFAEHHNKILDAWQLNGSEKAVNKYRRIWALDSQGFCFSCRVLVKVIVNSSSADYELLGYIQKAPGGGEESLLLDEDGEVVSIGKSWNKIFLLNPTNLIENKLNIQLLCPQLISTFSLAGQQLPKMVSFQAFPDGISVIFSIPKTLSNMLGTLTFKKHNLFLANGADSNGQDFSSLSEQQLFNLRLAYLTYLKNQIQVMGQDICSYHSVRFIMERKDFSVNGKKHKFIVLRLVSTKQSDSLQIKFLDRVEEIRNSLSDYLLRLKKIVKLQELRKTEKDETNQKSEKSNNPFRKRRLSNQLMMGPGDNKKMAYLTIKMLKESPHLRMRKLTKKNRRQTNFHQIFRQKPIDKERVKKNVNRIRFSLLREGIFSAKMVEVFELTKQQTILLKSKYNIGTNLFQTMIRTATLDDEDGPAGQSISEGPGNKNYAGQAESAKVASVASSAASISLNSAIKSLKEQLKKLHSPVLLQYLNYLVIVTVLILMALMATDLFLLNNNVTQYAATLELSYEANKMQSQMHQALDKIMFLELFKFNSDIVKQRIKQHLNSAGSLLHLHNTLYVSNLPVYSSGSFNYFKIQYDDGKQQSPYYIILAQLYNCYSKLSSAFNNVNYQLFESLIRLSHSTFHDVLMRMNNNERTKILMGMCIVVIFLAMVIGMLLAGRLVRKIQDTLNLFEKVSPKDVQKYVSHFKKFEMQLKMGDTLQEILHRQLQALDEDQDKKKKCSYVHKIHEPKAAAKNIKLYLRIACVALILILFFSARIVVYHIQFSLIGEIQEQFDRIKLLQIHQEERRILWKLTVSGTKNLSMQHFQSYFGGRQLELVDSLATCYRHQSALPVFKQKLEQLTKSNVCRMLPLSDSELQQCQTVNKGSLKKGIMDSLIDVNMFMQTHGVKYLGGTALDFDTIWNIENNHHFVVIAMWELQKAMTDNQKKNISNAEMVSRWHCYIVAFILFSGVIIGWRLIYHKIAKEASFCNAFLLLLPSNILKENPYVKMFIKNQFNLHGMAQP